MRWLTENPWPLMILLLGSGIAAAMLLHRQGRRIAVLCLAAAAGVWLIADLVETPGEQVREQMNDMLSAFIRSDRPTIESMISSRSPELKGLAARGLQMVELQNSFHLKDVRVEIQPDGKTAIAILRANGGVVVRSGGFSGHIATRWETTWERDATTETWQLTAVRRLKLNSDEEIDTFSSAQ